MSNVEIIVVGKQLYLDIGVTCTFGPIFRGILLESVFIKWFWPRVNIFKSKGMDDLDYCFTLRIVIYFHFCSCDHVNCDIIIANFISPYSVLFHSSSSVESFHSFVILEF